MSEVARQAFCTILLVSAHHISNHRRPCVSSGRSCTISIFRFRSLSNGILLGEGVAGDGVAGAGLRIAEGVRGDRLSQ